MKNLERSLCIFALASAFCASSCSSGGSSGGGGVFVVNSTDQGIAGTSQVVVSDEWLVYQADEATTGGGTDLNGDGDMTDAIAAVVDMTTGSEQTLDVAARELYVLDNTLVVYTADQGYAMGEHGMRMKIAPYDASYRSPLIISRPGAVAAGKVCKRVVNAPDLVATFFALAGVKPPTGEHALHQMTQYHSCMRAAAKDVTKSLVCKIIEPVPAKIQDGEGVFQNAAHPYLTLLFIEHAVSPEGQKILDEDNPLKSNVLADGQIAKLPKGKKVSLNDFRTYSKGAGWMKMVLEAYGFPKADR